VPRTRRGATGSAIKEERLRPRTSALAFAVRREAARKIVVEQTDRPHCEQQFRHGRLKLPPGCKCDPAPRCERQLCSGCCRSPLLGLGSVGGRKPTFSLAVGDARSVSDARYSRHSNRGGLPDPLNGSSRLARWARIDPSLKFGHKKMPDIHGRDAKSPARDAREMRDS
jgi:hypothetical protein